MHFKHKGLENLYHLRKDKRIAPALHKRALRILDTLGDAKTPEDMNVPGLRLHRYVGIRQHTYSVDVNGPWRITFMWSDDGPIEINLEQPH